MFFMDKFMCNKGKTRIQIETTFKLSLQYKRICEDEDLSCLDREVKCLCSQIKFHVISSKLTGAHFPLNTSSPFN